MRRTQRRSQLFAAGLRALTVEARGMSKVAKTILILQPGSWTAAHPGASCCALSMSGLHAFSTLPRGKQTLPRRRGSCGTTLTNAALNSRSASQRFELQKMSNRSSQRGSGLLTERGVWVPRPAVPDSSSSLNPGRISVLSCCPNSQ